jgi:shikimate kinase
MKGKGISHGAATIVNAIATGRGIAFGIDLKTRAWVELVPQGEIEVSIEGHPDEDTALITTCVRGVLSKYAPDKRYGAVVRTRSEIPISKGLKSSSAAANATVMATLDALSVECEALDAIRIGARAAIEAGVSVTGAFDDACASYLGGIVFTENLSQTLIVRDIMPEHLKCLLHIPDFQIRKRALPLERMKALGGIVDLAFKQAVNGDYFGAMIMNGLCYSAALKLDMDVAILALQNGALAAGLSGTGPATAILVEEDKVEGFTSALKDHKFMVTDIYNGEEEE